MRALIRDLIIDNAKTFPSALIIAINTELPLQGLPLPLKHIHGYLLHIFTDSLVSQLRTEFCFFLYDLRLMLDFGY
jgi:hypothetical protein